MLETPPPQRQGISVSEKDIATLNNYADKKLLETNELSEVMSTVPSKIQRGGIYLVSAVVGFAAIMLYFGRIPVWVNARGNIAPKVTVPIIAEENGVVTEIKAEVGEQLPKNATVFKVKSENLKQSSINDYQFTMPEKGIIAALEIDNPGQKIFKGGFLGTIIPSENNFIVKANISEKDISSIKPGMEALVKIDAYNFHQYGSISARVNQIIPDMKQPGNFIITLDLIKDNQKINLLPGLNAQVEIQVKESSLYSILFSK